MGYNEKELLGKVEKEKNEKQDIVLPPKKETIGDILKNKREESGKSIEYISDYLRIKSQYLKALEENNFNSLPGQAYVIGFIKSYATFLNIPDVQKLINQYKSENSQSSSDGLKMSDENSIMEDPIINSNHIIFISILIILGVFLIYIFTNKSNETQNLTPSQNEFTQNETSNNNLETEEVEIVISSPLEKSSEEGNKQKEETLTPVNDTEEKVEEPTSQTINFVNFVYDNEQQSVHEEMIEIPTHTPVEYGVDNKYESQIKLKAKDKVWVKLKKNGFYKYDSENGDVGTGESVFETILENGDIYYVPNEENLYLTIGNAQGIDIIVNDEEVIKPLSPRPISRHNIEMDVNKLQNGTAYIRNRIIE